MSKWRGSADGPLVVLAVLALALVGALAVFLARNALLVEPFTRCDTPGATLWSRLGTVGLLVPAALIAQVLLATALALGHQGWTTRRVLSRVLARRVPPSDRLRRLAVQAGLGARLDVVADSAVFTFCYGLWRPRVCLSTGLAALLDDAELLAVLRHEAHHRRHRDPLKILASRALASGLFFLPLAGALHDAYLAAKELCADADASPDGDDLPLAGALVKLVRARRPAWPAGVLAVGSFSATEARLQRLVRPGEVRTRTPSATDWLVSGAIVAVIFAFSGGAVAAAEALPVEQSCRAAAVRAAPTTGSAGTAPVRAPVGMPR